MSHEILYTSAPKLLKAGVSGYGTVISTRGISSHLAEKLESLSGYRWAFEQGDSKARLNPVCFSHVIITVAGQRYHVLSRVSDYGADYSGRSNKIAHHIALSDTELTAGGPAWLLKSPGFCESTWDQQTRVIEAGRQPIRTVRSSADYSSWKRATGDAGWAGVLAETALPKERRPVHVLFPLGMDTLSLVEEALNLLPHRERWKVSFSTYYNSLPASIDCLWRFVLDGTPEAANLRRQPHQTIIDLCCQLGLPTGGELVERAREGWQPTLATSSATPTRLPSKDSPAATRPVPPSGPTKARTESSTTQQYRIDADVPDSTAPPVLPAATRLHAHISHEDEFEQPRVRGIPVWATLLICLFVGVGTGATGFWFGKTSELKKLQAGANQPMHSEEVNTHKNIGNEVAAAPPTNANGDGKRPPREKRQAVEDSPTSSPLPPQPGGDVMIATTGTPTTPSSDEPIPSEKPSTPDVEATASSAASGAEGEPDYLTLPEWNSVASKNEPQRIKTGVSNVNPEVFGGSAFLNDNLTFRVTPTSGEAEWKLETVQIDADPGQPQRVNEVGVFSVRSGELLFTWSHLASAMAQKAFAKCLVRLDTNGKVFPTFKPFEYKGGCILPDKAPSFIDLTSGSFTDQAQLDEQHVALRNTFLDGWEFVGLPQEYSVSGQEKVLYTLNERSLVLGIAKDGTEIATVEMLCRHQKGKDDSENVTIDFQLKARIPKYGDNKAAEKLWIKPVRFNDSYYSMAKISDAIAKNDGKIKAGDDWMSFAKKAWDSNGKTTAYGKEHIPNTKIDLILKQDQHDDLNAAEMNGLASRIKELNRDRKVLVEKQADLANLKSWREKMDELSKAMETSTRLRFNVAYNAKIDNQPVRVVIGVITTELPFENSGETDSAANKGDN